MFRASIASLLEQILSSKHTDLTPTLIFIKSPELLESFMIRRTTDWETLKGQARCWSSGVGTRLL